MARKLSDDAVLVCAAVLFHAATNGPNVTHDTNTDMQILFNLMDSIRRVEAQRSKRKKKR
jgi:hypothetical protein